MSVYEELSLNYYNFTFTLLRRFEFIILNNTHGERSMIDVVVIMVRKIFLISFLRNREKSAFKSQAHAVFALVARAVLGSVSYAWCDRDSKNVLKIRVSFCQLNTIFTNESFAAPSTCTRHMHHETHACNNFYFTSESNTKVYICIFFVARYRMWCVDDWWCDAWIVLNCVLFKRFSISSEIN